MGETAHLHENRMQMPLRDPGCHLGLFLHRKPTSRFFLARVPGGMQILLARSVQPRAAKRPRPGPGRLLPLAILGCMLICSPGAVSSQQQTEAWRLAKSNPTALMEAVVHNEIANSYGHHAGYRYCVRKTTLKSDTTKEIVETPVGGVARLLQIDGHALTPQQQQAEIARLRALEANPSLEEHRRRREEQDAARTEKILRELPKAFLYQPLGAVQTPSGPAIRLHFSPNPRFDPPDFEARVLTGIDGEAWIDPAAERLLRIDARVSKPIDYGWAGFLGSIEPGGTILLEQTSQDGAGWRLSHLQLNLRGRALLVKPLHFFVDETATDFQPVPADWTLHDAIAWLLRMEPATR